MKRWLALFLFLAFACASAERPPVHVVIVGTTDVHGTIERLPQFATELEQLRAANPGRVILVDSGDVFQGTLESNLFEGEPMVKAYNALHYDAVAVGNHEFDYGPAGPASVPEKPGDDPLGALAKNAANATWPFLSANLADRRTGVPPPWIKASKLVTIDGVKVGIIGLTTPDTPNTTMPENVANLIFGSPVANTTAAANALRKAGADAIIVIAHMGGSCRDMNDVNDVASCNPAGEAMHYLNGLPPHAIDAYFGGHTHQQMRQIIFGFPAVQALPYGREFSTIDLWIDPAHHKVVRGEIRPLTAIKDVAPDPRIAAILKPYADRVATKRNEKLGLRIAARFTRSFSSESSLGDLLADAMREWGNADAGFVNSGGIRTDLMPGELTYGEFFELCPFDNYPAVVEMTGQQIADALRLTSVGAERGVLQVSGIRYVVDMARRQDDRVASVTLANGQPLDPKAIYRVAMPDFLAKGGDGLAPVMKTVPPTGIRIDHSLPIRDVLIAVLQRHARAPLVPKTDGRITVVNAPAGSASP